MPREVVEVGGPWLQAEPTPPQLGLVEEVHFSERRARAALRLNSHAHHHSTLRHGHGRFVNEQHVHAVRVVRVAPASLNINQ